MNNSNVTIEDDFTLGENLSIPKERYRPTLEMKGLIIGIFGLVIVVGIVGNVIVLLLIGLKKSMHTNVNRGLFVLAVADLLILVFLPIQPIGGLMLGHHSFLGITLCYFINFYDRGAVVCSVLIFFFLSVDRYFAICYPMKNRQVWSGRNINIALVIIWIIAIASSIPYFYVSAYIDDKQDNITAYYCFLKFDETWQIQYDTAMSIIIFFVPIPILIFLYGRMISVLRKAAPGDSTEEGNSTTGRRGRLQVIIMLLSVVIIFIVCQIPFTMLILLHYYSPHVFTFKTDTLVKYLFTWLCRILVHVNSAANPFVYFLVSTKFREVFWSKKRETWTSPVDMNLPGGHQPSRRTRTSPEAMHLS